MVSVDKDTRSKYSSWFNDYLAYSNNYFTLGNYSISYCAIL